MRVVTNDGHELRVQVHGDGPLDVLLVHGWMVGGDVWNDVIASLPRGRVRLVVPDLRGAGESARPESGYDLEQYVDDVIRVADAVGAKKFALVGHSMGGQISQLLALRHPDRVLGAALLCPVPLGGLDMPPEVIALFSSCAGDRDKQTAILGAACKQLSDDARERILATSLRTGEAAIRQGFDAFRLGLPDVDLGSVRAPVLCVATDDPFLPPAFLESALVSRVARGSLVYLPGPGHYLGNERPLEVAAIVGAFLAGLSRSIDA